MLLAASRKQPLLLTLLQFQPAVSPKGRWRLALDLLRKKLVNYAKGDNLFEESAAHTQLLYKGEVLTLSPSKVRTHLFRQ